MVLTKTKWRNTHATKSVVHNYFNAYVSITKLLLSWYYDQLLLEMVSGPSEVLFLGGFSFLTMLRWAKGSFGLVAPPIHPLTTYATVPGLALVTAPCLSSSFQPLHYIYNTVFPLIIRTTIPAVTFTYMLCVCWWVWLIRPTLCIKLVWQV